MNANYGDMTKEQLVALLQKQQEEAAEKARLEELARKYEGIRINDKGNIVVKVAERGFPFGGSVKKFIALANKTSNILDFISENWDKFKVGNEDDCSFKNDEEKSAVRKLLNATKKAI